MTIQLYAKC